MIKQLTNVVDLTRPYFKVYCDFHKRDVNQFIRIKDDFFKICKCMIFYYDDEYVEKSELDFSISDFNLYVLIVSSNLFCDPNFDRKAFQIAVAKNIPILPIVIENGLEDEFSQRFGNIQYINTCIDVLDPTVIPYIDKLRNYLSKTFSLSLEIN